MKTRALALLAAAIPTLLSAQASRDIPAGSPLGAGDAGAAQAQDAAQAQAQASAQARLREAARERASRQAMADAFAPPPALAVIDEGRPIARSSTLGESDGSADAPRRAPSPYGGFYQIRTPWDRR